MIWDVIIVGAGIAGLHVGIETLKLHPKSHVLILEKYNYVGGRIVTYRHKGNQWEIGAGRIAANHKKVLGLMTRYGLHSVPIGTGESNRILHNEIVPNPFLSLMSTYLSPLFFLPDSVLASHTLADLLKDIHGSKKAAEFYHLFPYWAEIHLMRADYALKSFMSEFAGTTEFYGCAEGLGSITDHMAAEFKERGGTIRTETELIRVEDGGKTLFLKDETLETRTTVLALHSDALKKLTTIIPKMPFLKHLQMSPLVRMYAVFPTSWFKEVGRIVTENPVRYIIPVNPKKHIVMISYTDGKDASHWMRRQKEVGDKGVQKEVMAEIRKLFPDISIPDPTLFKIYPWTSGCTYWLPSSTPFDPADVSLHIDKHLFVCGESVSTNQAWMEGALDSAFKLLTEKAFRDCIDI